MTSGHFELLTRAQEFITDHYRNHINPSFVFHNLVHTQEVVAASEEMAEFFSSRMMTGFHFPLRPGFMTAAIQRGWPRIMNRKAKVWQLIFYKNQTYHRK